MIFGVQSNNICSKATGIKKTCYMSFSKYSSDEDCFTCFYVIHSYVCMSQLLSIYYVQNMR